MPAAGSSVRKKVLFVCIGNSCRSQMAEGFARAYGSDVIEAASAGLMPADIVQPLTSRVMEEKGVSLAGHFPKALSPAAVAAFDLIVNISGDKLPCGFPPGKQWNVQDPIGGTEKRYRQVRDQIENLVMLLVLELRQQAPERPRRPPRF